MAITASITVTPAAPNHGDTVKAVYTVQGNDPVPPTQASVGGDVTVGTEDISVTTTLTLPGTAALPESFQVPTCPGLTFTVDTTDDPTGATFTAVVP